MNQPAAVSVRSLWAGYKKHPVLKDFSCHINQGELAAIIGANGCGKTTLLKLILGLLEPEMGSIEILGRPLRKANLGQIRKQIGYLPQLNPHPSLPITVGETVLLGRWGSSFSWFRFSGASDTQAARECLRLLGIEKLFHRDIRSLSGGQLQRTYLARAISRRPAIVLMDEPTTYLDQESKEDLLAGIISLHRQLGTTTIMVTHDKSSISDFDQVIELEPSHG